jgi:hypothetical protein
LKNSVSAFGFQCCYNAGNQPQEVMSKRGADQDQDGMFSYLSPAARVPKDHPLRPIKKMANQALRELWLDFENM